MAYLYSSEVSGLCQDDDRSLSEAARRTEADGRRKVVAGALRTES